MKNFISKAFLLIFLSIIVTNGLYAQNSAKSEKRRGKFFADGKYAMFIHWGLYSNLAGKWNGKTHYGISEWLMYPGVANIPISEYMATAQNFNPVKFNAKEIAQLAKDAGMKYIIITSKHHDGFAMFHSKANKFNIVDATPFKRDPMKELADACKELGLGFGFYYSHNQDWTHPGGSGGPKTDENGNQKTIDNYFLEKCLPQVEEITKNYGEIELIWFDTPGEMSIERSKQLVDVVHRNQPHTLVSGRIGYNLGDYVTYGDMEVPLENVEGLWEGIDVTNDSWGYAWYDENWKTPKQVLITLISTIARGGTFMLNIGPDGLGRIPEPAQQTLLASGKWIKQYPQLVYGAEASPWKHSLPWGDIVKQGDKLFLAVFDWPTTGKLYLPGLQTTIISAKILDGSKSQQLNFEKEGDWVVFNIPYKSPEETISVIELELSGEPVVNNTMAVDPNIGITMSSKFSNCFNCTTKQYVWMGKWGEWKHTYRISEWKDNSTANWEIMVKEPGYYQIDVDHLGEDRLVWQVVTDEGKTIQNQQPASNLITKQAIGMIKFDKAGKHTITVKLLEGNKDKAGLISMSIKPVKF